VKLWNCENGSRSLSLKKLFYKFFFLGRGFSVFATFFCMFLLWELLYSIVYYTDAGFLAFSSVLGGFPSLSLL
jgi:fumarate reductase subunit C